MSFHSFDLQSAIYSTLNDDSTLDVRIGNISVANMGTKTLDGNEYSIDIDVWSRYRGKKEISDAMERIYDLLHEATYSVSGANMVVSQVRSTTTLRENDGLTAHGVIFLSVIVYDN